MIEKKDGNEEEKEEKLRKNVEEEVKMKTIGV